MIGAFYISCIRQRPTKTLVNGRYHDVYTPTSIMGYLGSVTDRQQIIADKNTSKSIYKFYCDDFDLRIGDYIDYENQRFEVISHPKNCVHRFNHIKSNVQRSDI
jgi:hypothetical protein